MIPWLLSRFLNERTIARLVPWLVLLALLGAGIAFGSIFAQSQPLKNWLFFRYALIWLCALGFCAACFSVGNLIVTRLSAPEERDLGHFTLSFSTGVFAFFLLTAAVGFAGGFGKVAFFLIPLSLFAAGFPELRRSVKAWRERSEREGFAFRLSAWEALGFGVGAVALAVIYMGVLVPDNAAYDSRWYHLGIAEHYAVAGHVVRSVEGAVTTTIPHLASFLYTWAYLLPGVGLFERVELAAHLEFVIFLCTLPGVVALVRYLVPDAKAHAAWVALFAFPSIFVYDSSLHLASDHIAALWTIPTYLACMRAYRHVQPRSGVLLAIQLSGLAMAKYTALIAAVGPLLFISARVLELLVRRLRHQEMAKYSGLGFLTALGSGLVFTAPHWLKNWVWYGDPLYPILHRHLAERPWNSDGAFLFDVYQSENWAATGSLLTKLNGMLRALWNYSYALYNWGDFHGSYAVFGSLFTLSLAALPFLSRTRRLWALVLAAHLGIAFWFWFFHSERYLQALLPWMAAGIAAIATLAWRTGIAARAGIIAVWGLQLVWGLDMIFWPLHRMNGHSGIGLASEFFAKGYKGSAPERLRPFDDYASVGRMVPKNAKVLVHHDHLHVGIGTVTVSDAIRIQYGINYGELGSPRALHKLLKDFGVTHVTWEKGVVYGDESLAGELVFHSYAARYLVRPKVKGSRTVAELPAKVPENVGHSAFVFVCDGTYQPGLYDLKDLRVSPYTLPEWPKKYPAPRRPLAGDADALAASAAYAVINPKCAGAPTLRGFRSIAHQSTAEFYAREWRSAGK